MVDILHKIGIQAPPPAVYRALTTIDGLAGWWTTETAGETGLGDVIRFRFKVGGFDMKLLELDGARRIGWQVVDGPPEWLGTRIDWQLHEEAGWTLVYFKHEGWREPVPFMHHCSTKWAVFLISLKAMLETGKGTPWPHELKIDSWE